MKNFSEADVADSVVLKKKELTILAQGAKKAINFKTRKVIRSLQLGRQKLEDAGVKTITKETTLSDLEKIILDLRVHQGIKAKNTHVNGSSTSNCATSCTKNEKFSKSQKGKRMKEDGQNASKIDIDDKKMDSDSMKIVSLMQQYRQRLKHLQLFREFTPTIVATEYLYRQKRKNIESRRKKFLKRKQRRTISKKKKSELELMESADTIKQRKSDGPILLQSKRKDDEHGQQGKQPSDTRELDTKTSINQESFIAQQVKYIDKKIIGGSLKNMPTSEIDAEMIQKIETKKSLISELLETKSFIESIEALQSYREKQTFEAKLAKQRIKRREANLTRRASVLTMNDMWIGQRVKVVSYSRLKAICLDRYEMDQRQKNSGGNEMLDKGNHVNRNDNENQEQIHTSMKRAARWLGDKGSKADLYGEIIKLDNRDGTVQVRLQRIVQRKWAGNNGGETQRMTSEFNDWFLPAALCSQQKQSITKAESVAREKAKLLLQEAGAETPIVIAKGTEASNLKGRARKRAARAEIHRRMKLLRQSEVGENGGTNRPAKAESMFLETLGTGLAEIKSTKRRKSVSSSKSVKRGKAETQNAGVDASNAAHNATRLSGDAASAHPSWKAKQAQKELLRKAISSGGTGKRIVFDD